MKDINWLEDQIRKAALNRERIDAVTLAEEMGYALPVDENDPRIGESYKVTYEWTGTFETYVYMDEDDWSMYDACACSSVQEYAERFKTEQFIGEWTDFQEADQVPFKIIDFIKE